MNNEDLIESHELIHECENDDQTSALGRVIEDLEPIDLSNINDYLNAGVEANSDWRTYWTAFSHFEWYEFSYAFHHVMSRDLSLD